MARTDRAAAPASGSGARTGHRPATIVARIAARLHRRRAPLLALGDQAVSSVSTFAAGVLVARAVSVEAFGVYTLVAVALVWANGVHAALVTTPYTYQQGQCDPARRQGYQGSVLVHHWLLCGVVALGIAPVVAAYLSTPAAPRLFAPIATAAVGVLVREYVRATCYAHGAFGQALLVNAGSAALQVGGMTALWATGGLTVSTALLVLGVPPLVVASPLLLARIRRARFSLGESVRQLPGSWAFGRWLVAGFVITALSRDAYPWVLAALHGTETTGRYAAHLNIALLVNPAVIGFANYLAPSFARTVQEHGPAALVARARATAGSVGLAMMLYVLLLLVSAGAISAAVYGDRLQAAGSIVALIALGLTVTAFSMPYGTALFALGRADVNFRAAAAALVATLLVGIPLIWALGIPGAALSFVLSASVEHAIKWRALRSLAVTAPAMVAA